MLAKTCLACGYRGPALEGPERALRCPSCGEDLYARPPKSYAELEGFLPSDDTIDMHSRPAQGTRRRRIGQARSLAVRVLVMALIITPPLVVVAAAGALAAIWMLRG